MNTTPTWLPLAVPDVVGPNLPDGQYRVLAAIYRFIRPAELRAYLADEAATPPFCWPTYSAVMAVSGKARSSAIRICGELTVAGQIRRARRVVDGEEREGWEVTPCPFDGTVGGLTRETGGVSPVRRGATRVGGLTRETGGVSPVRRGATRGGGLTRETGGVSPVRRGGSQTGRSLHLQEIPIELPREQPSACEAAGQLEPVASRSAAGPEPLAPEPVVERDIKPAHAPAPAPVAPGLEADHGGAPHPTQPQEPPCLAAGKAAAVADTGTSDPTPKTERGASWSFPGKSGQTELETESAPAPAPGQLVLGPVEVHGPARGKARPQRANPIDDPLASQVLAAWHGHRLELGLATPTTRAPLLTASRVVLIKKAGDADAWLTILRRAAESLRREAEDKGREPADCKGAEYFTLDSLARPANRERYAEAEYLDKRRGAAPARVRPFRGPPVHPENRPPKIADSLDDDDIYDNETYTWDKPEI